MPSETVRISRKDATSSEIVEYLDEGKRVLVTVSVLGAETEVTLRKTDGEYVCDTGVKVMSYDDRGDMKTCIERLQLAESE